jgi:hypothetical protein
MELYLKDLEEIKQVAIAFIQNESITKEVWEDSTKSVSLKPDYETVKRMAIINGVISLLNKKGLLKELVSISYRSN